MAKKQIKDNKPKMCPFCGSKKLIFVHADEHDDSVHNAITTYDDHEDSMDGYKFVERYECDKDHAFYVFPEEKEELEEDSENDEEIHEVGYDHDFGDDNE